MGEFFLMVPTLLLVAAVAYILGALPLADQISRRQGIDIFSAGTGLAGASNVHKSVGRVPGLVVFVGDLGKGALAMLFAGFVGLEGPWILVAAGAVVVVHWNSIFTGFRGGDGMSPLGGATIALFPILGLLCVAVAIVVAIGGQKLPYSSLLSIVFGYTTLVSLTLAQDGETVLALGTGGLAGFVLAHALLGHRRRNSQSLRDWDDMAEADAAIGPSESRS